MTNFVREDVDALNIVLTCTIPAADYAPKVKANLRKIQQQASIKGFRPGKVPQAMIDKMYEKGAIHDAVVAQLDEDLNKYLFEVRYLGQPLPAEDNFQPTNLKANTDFSFTYEIGLFPEITVQGLDESTEIERYEIIVTEEMIDKEVFELRKQYGQRGDVDNAGDESILTVKLTELDENGAAKADGVVKEDAKFLMSSLSASTKALLLGKSVGDAVSINIFEMEDNIAPERINSWVLGIDKNAEINPMFDVAVLEIKDMVPATVDSAFFDTVFGVEGEIRDEAAMREMYRRLISEEYDRSATNIAMDTLFDELLAKNTFAVPETFLRKWFKFSDAKMTDEKMDSDWANILKDIRWSIIKTTLTKEAGVNVTEADVRHEFAREIQQYLGTYGDVNMINGMVQRMMQNEEQVDKRVQNIVSTQILLYALSKVKALGKPVSVDEFTAIIEARQRRNAAVEAAVVED